MNRDMSHAAATRVPILLATVALAHFALAGRFGLYSDDWSFFAPFVNDSLPQALARIGRGIGSGYEGRPLGAIAPGVVGYLIGLTGSFIAASVAGACIIACNAELLWRLVNRVAGPWYAWATALAFILSPVDLTRELPMHAVILQLSVTCTLVAAHFVATGRERAAPFIGLLSLLTYESPYFLLAAVPLLAATPWSRRRWLVFLVQLAVVFVVYGIVRAATGESRISDLSTYGRAMLVFRIASGIVIGPVSALALAIAGPFRWIRLDELGSLTSSAVPAFYLLGHTLLAMVLLVVAMRWRSSEILAGGTRNDATRLLVGAVAMLPYAYLLSFTHYPPTASIGMDMSVHLAASVPIAVIIGCGAGWLLERRRVLFRAIVLAYGLGMLATLIRVQQGFAREWDLERSVYRQLLVHVPDLDAHTRVVLDVRDSLAARPEVPKWGYPESIALMVQAGAATGDGPRFIRPPDPRPDSAGPWYHRFEPAAYARLKSAKYLRRSQGEFSEPRLRVGADGRREWRPDVDLPVWESFDDKRLVHLVLQRGRVTRVNEPIMLDGISMPVSAPGPAYLRLSRLGEVIAGSASPR